MTAWLRVASRHQARVRLFCFPHAGGGGSSYRLWPRELPEQVEVCAIQPPGREDRLREPPIASVDLMVAAIVPAILSRVDLPFAFFGQSMGAVVASEVAHELAARGEPLPAHLMVSARRPPHVPALEPPLHLLADDEFVAEIRSRYGGIPPEVLREPDLMALLLPTLRADVEALETHRAALRAPLSVPITAMGGAADRLTPAEHLQAWRSVTKAAFGMRIVPGGHFYLDAQRPQVLAFVSAILAPLWSNREREATV